MLGIGTPLPAQQPPVPGSEADRYLRLLELDGGAAPLAGPWRDRYEAGSETWLRLIGPDLRVSYRSGYPREGNDGALWTGRGLTAEARGGVVARWGPLTATLYPTAYWSQNRAFETMAIADTTLSPYAYPWGGGAVDWPQRFGDDAVTAIDWGQSGIRLDLGAFTAGLSTENMWWGPAYRNAIVLSNAGPGFPHLDVGVGRPVGIGVGRLEGRLLWGALAESDHFDRVATNDRRFFVGLTLGWEPKWLPGLTLGLTRTFQTPWDSLGAHDVFAPFQSVFKNAFGAPTDPASNDDRDQLLSLTARWLLPESGFELYVEWARNDHNLDLRDLLLEPDHSRAYTLGLAKALPSGEGRVLLRGEITALGRSATFQDRAYPTYYLHYIVRQGHTHRGQMLGAAIGPGAESEFLSVDRYGAHGRWGVFVQRVVFNNDAYYQNFAGTRGHDVELTAGASALRFAGPADLGFNLELSRELNRYYRVRNDVTNLTIGMSLGWPP